MTKKYIEQLAEWVKEHETSRIRKGKSLVAFLAVKADVKEAMDAGYSLKTIWEHMHESGKIPCRYETFLKYVGQYIKNMEPLNPSEKIKKDRKPTQNNSPNVSGFVFNATPKKEDLI
ncbi:TraK family protein [Bartonella sp. F02]|uniref:TraK family protein n=1 Tax=Bartonella sp. F02 TaxID=2967262 RepID=UPI0022A95BB7|nr:TraK family protein [Bartonella sp. F02]MCZ2328967.1 TraK family protein [Bartonella sp. F02]